MEEVKGVSLEIVEKVGAALGDKGIFLTTSGEKDNSMIIGWGSVGIMWNHLVFMVPVRHSRFTHKQLAVGGDFTLSVPGEGMEEAFRVCGSQSGKDMDKFAACGMRKQPGKLVGVPVIGGCPYHLECRILAKTETDDKFLAEEVNQQWYVSHPGQGLHSLYFAKVLAAYEG